MVKNIGYLFILIGFLLSNSRSEASVFISNSITQKRPSTPKESPKPKTAETGKDIYVKYCMSCHQQDGSGVPYTFPTLQKSNWVNGDKTKLIKVVLNGLEGEIDVNGETFNGTMPKQNNLTDNQIALVLTYLRQSFGNKASVVNPAEVKKTRGK